MPDLNCTEFEAQLEELVETHQALEDLPEETSDPQSQVWQNLRGHANACARCRHLWNDFALLERVLPPWKDGVPAVDLADAVLARCQDEDNPDGPSSNSRPAMPHRFPSRPHFLGPLFFVSALALLACFAFWLAPPTDEDLPQTVPVVTTGPQDPPESEEGLSQNPEPEKTEAAMDWDTVAQEAGSAYWLVASDTAEAFASVRVLMPARKPSEQPQTPADAKPEKPWTQGLGERLKPIGQDIGRASGFLLDALPRL